MYHTLLGEDGFQKGMRLYFKRHDGTAVTCNDFLAAMADANDTDLQKFGRWYGQSGTPELSASGSYDATAKTFTLHLSQRTPPTHDQAEKQPLVIPVAVGLISSDGTEIPLQLSGDGSPEPQAQAMEGERLCRRQKSASGMPSRVGAGKRDSFVTSRLLVLEEAQQSFVFQGVNEQPVPSLLRGFSAPVKLEYPYSSSDLAVLMAHDSDAFVRWEAAQLLAQGQILRNVENLAEGSEPFVGAELINAFAALLADVDSDPALVAEALSLPGEDYLAEQMDVVDVDGIHSARKFVKSGLANTLRDAFASRYKSMSDNGPYSKSPASMACRSLRNVCLSYLLETASGAALAEAQLKSSDNMTDTLAALQGLVWVEAPGADAALRAFEEQWSDDALVMDKWFSIQASIPGERTVERVRKLLDHPGFSIANPNKVRSLTGVFSMMNPTGFHTADGSGYRLHADQVITLDSLNPQMAARMAGAFNPWTRYDDRRRSLMKSELNRIASVESLSPDVSEIIHNALGMEKAGAQS
jgi:aminopeptidase N